MQRQGDQRVTVEPPLEWGSGWRWNLTEDGAGIAVDPYSRDSITLKNRVTREPPTP